MALSEAAGWQVALMLGLVLLVWMVPIGLTVWLVRSFAAMAAAQRDIARSLASIDEQMRGGRRPGA